MSVDLGLGGLGWVDEFVLALAARGATDRWVSRQRAWVRDLLAFAGVPVWGVGPGDVDGWLAAARARGAGPQTRGQMAQAVHRFYVFVQIRHAQDVQAVTGGAVVQPVDEFNRPRRLARVGVRVPPSEGEVELLFSSWRLSLPGVRGRGFLVAARDYVAASLWRRLGLRINESVHLRVGDWYPRAGSCGMLHVRCGKGAGGGSGPRQRLVPAIDGVDRLLAWWMSQVRGQFGDDLAAGRAVLLPSRCRTADGGGLRPACAVTLRQGLARAVGRWLPAWSGRLTPHPLRHFCASHLYGQGMDLEAIGALLGHTWISTTARYVHVPAERVEWHWRQANARLTGRLLPPVPVPVAGPAGMVGDAGGGC
ncbi:tyrosine-type recombinase/integrase [Streptomyces anthocyanicus]|uniref:tyrosine-type recombinase/integrase n=1 Tax=Streptomyces anthocyanicus TaxID=68174 RepID=UPI00364B1143